MTNPTDWTLIDIGTHPYQTIDDPTALARYADSTDRPAAAAALRDAARKLTDGRRRYKLTREDAAAIEAASHERCLAIQALIHEAYVNLRPDPTANHRMGLHVTAKADQLLEQSVTRA